jgi:hypothetical protein
VRNFQGTFYKKFERCTQVSQSFKIDCKCSSLVQTTFPSQFLELSVSMAAEDDEHVCILHGSWSWLGVFL